MLIDKRRGNNDKRQSAGQQEQAQTKKQRPNADYQRWSKQQQNHEKAIRKTSECVVKDIQLWIKPGLVLYMGCRLFYDTNDIA